MLRQLIAATVIAASLLSASLVKAAEPDRTYCSTGNSGTVCVTYHGNGTVTTTYDPANKGKAADKDPASKKMITARVPRSEAVRVQAFTPQPNPMPISTSGTGTR